MSANLKSLKFKAACSRCSWVDMVFPLDSDGYVVKILNRMKNPNCSLLCCVESFFCQEN